MARIYFNKASFESVRSESWNEADFEQVILSNASILFPQWIAVPFKVNVTGEDGTVKQPDLALIDHSYRRWCVVEVELAHHNFMNHVLPQVEAFRTAAYGDQHVAYLHQKNSALDVDRLRAMVRGEPPEVVVVVDRPDTGWKSRLRQIDVALTIVEAFRGQGTQFVLRVNGELPELPGNVLTRLTRWKVRRLWKVHSPATLPEPKDGTDALEVSLDNSVTLWNRTVLGGAVLLSAKDGGDLLRGWKSVDLVQHEDGSLSFQPVAAE